MATHQTTTRLRLDYLHGLRGLAALAVVAGHCAQMSAPDALERVPFLRLFAYASSLAVPTFIVLSGYCLALPVVRHPQGRLDGGAWGFMVRRARRILPAYYGALVLCLAVALAVTHATTIADLRAHPANLLGPLFLLHDVYGTPHAYDPPLWSLAIEWHIYFLFPFLVAAWRRWGLPLSATGALALSLLAIGPLQHLGLWWVMPQMYALFVLGATAAWLAAHPRTRALLQHAPRRGVVLSAGCATGFGCLLWRAGWSTYTAHPAPFALCWGLVALMVLVALPHSLPRLRAALGARALRRLGAVSYSLYLLHWLPISVMAPALAGWAPAQHWPAPLTFAVLLAVAVPASLALAAISYRLCERPYLAPRTRERRPEPRAAAAHSFHNSTVA